MINKRKRIISGVLFLLSINLWGILAHAASVESATWRAELYNDFLFDKDNKITAGWSLQKHSVVAESWDALEDVPKFVGGWGEFIPTLTKEGLVYRAGLAIGQLIQTPKDLSRSDLITNDVPYAGALTVQGSWYAFNDDEFRGAELTLGVVGPLAGARELQEISHQVAGNAPAPSGWPNQISNELIINMNYTRKLKVGQWGDAAGTSFDASLHGDVGLGNMYTLVGAGLEMRWGHNMPGGFAYIPVPIGLSMHYLASQESENPQLGSYYATLALRGNAFAYNIFLDGNTYRQSHRVDKKPLVGLVVVGLHYEREQWGIHLNAMVTSDNVDTGTASAAQGDERLASAIIEYYF